MTIGTPSLDDQFLASTVPRKHPCTSKIKHWQLRDLLHCPVKGELVHVYQNQLLRHNTATKSSSALFENLSFFPSSITASFGYAAAGGEKSELIVRQMDDNWFASTSVGGSINNALTITEHSFGTRLYVSNNDQTVKVLQLPTLETLATLPLSTAINYAVVAPDGKTLIAVGDTPEVFMFDISPTGDYKLVNALTGEACDVILLVSAGGF